MDVAFTEPQMHAAVGAVLDIETQGLVGEEEILLVLWNRGYRAPFSDVVGRDGLR